MAVPKKSILITGGGTGGHLSPGIALFEECRASGIDCYMLIGERDRKFTYLHEVDSDRLLHYNAPTLTKNPFKLPFFVLRFFFTVFRARRILRKYNIEAVIGMGGYVSAPMLFAARMKGLPYWLCEQNTVPGKVTFSFAKKARAIFTTFEDTKKFVKPQMAAKCVTVGNPVRKKVFVDSTVHDARKVFSLDHCDKVILVIGGSQGALSLNELVVGMKTKFLDEFSRIGIIWCTGAGSFEKYRTLVREQNNMGSIFISPFVEDIGMAYRASDLAIARSGSGVMVELAAMGVPSILIPFPYAADDHQNKNADVFARSGASEKVDNKQATAEYIAPMVLDILSSDQRLALMSKKALSEARIDAAKRIIMVVTQ
jgi:UDP-N-acetylglucosamine--N-acetylmuramyl-(pentapeptide) pyrophosphoryl-undecaprenol N-acetylglucosamine transferase